VTTAVACRWTDGVPPLGDQLLVVAPHPDDEVIAAAGLMTWCAAAGVPIRLVAVTDGEMSHARSRCASPDELRERRAVERLEALAVLDLHPSIERLGIADGYVAGRERELADALADRAAVGVTLVAPWRRDRHADHEAAGRAAHDAARRTGATLWEVPIWAKVAGTVDPGPGRRSHLVLDPDLAARKARAVACFASQLAPLGPDPLDGPVVHPHELATLLDGHEAVLWR